MAPGGGWQFAGGVWPGIKLIEGSKATENDPEFGISRGRLLPKHHVYSDQEITRDAATTSRVACLGPRRNGSERWANLRDGH